MREVATTRRCKFEALPFAERCPLRVFELAVLLSSLRDSCRGSGTGLVRAKRKKEKGIGRREAGTRNDNRSRGQMATRRHARLSTRPRGVGGKKWACIKHACALPRMDRDKINEGN